MMESISQNIQGVNFILNSFALTNNLCIAANKVLFLNWRIQLKTNSSYHFKNIQVLKVVYQNVKNNNYQ